MRHHKWQLIDLYQTLKWYQMQLRIIHSQLHSFIAAQIVGNKAKGRISKRVFQENKAR